MWQSMEMGARWEETKKKIVGKKNRSGVYRRYKSLLSEGQIWRNIPVFWYLTSLDRFGHLCFVGCVLWN